MRETVTHEVGVRTLSPGGPGAPLVVFAHGLEDSWTSWLPVAGELDPAWRALALELPWRPGNDYAWRGRSPGHWLARALDLVGEAPDALVAHSFGAGAALELLCAGGPAPAASAALVCPLYRMPSQPVGWHAFDRSRTTFMQHVRDSVRAGMGSRADTVDPAVLAAMMELALDRVGPIAFLTVFEQFVASAALRLENAAPPAIVLAGGADPTLSRRAAVALAGAMPDARLVYDPGYDHFCHIRHAHRIAGLVADLVGTVRAETRTAGNHR
ncbi:alpha/beta fold hydrolase [Actinomadura sediminis]|uniref:Alpha/beta fold hydrolase n=1 Tax=Actinomadura sediminis TaxID=1038904 RepID=A0ABW3EM37_9ACTN